MKFLRLLTVLAVSAMTSALFATQNARAFVTITSDEGIADVVNLYEDDAVTNYSECMSDQYATMGDPVNVWVVANSTNYSKVKLASLNNLVLKFKANSEESFTMSFTYVTGTKTISLKRSDVDTTIIAAAANTYEFTCTANQEITFTINPTVEYNYTREIATGKWGTICFPEAITEVVGATIYQFTSLSGNQVTADVVTLPLEKGKAYLFLASADKQGFNYSSSTTANDPVKNNGLIGKFADYTTGADDADAYVIKGNSLIPAAVGSSVPANRAYVQKLSDIPTTPAPTAPGRKIFNIVNTPTGVEMLEAAPAMDGKMIINGQLIIMKGGKMFNAQGAAL